jgi:nitroreductase
MNETMKTILNRRSIRAYQQQQIKDEELQAILDAGRFAPSAINEQPWHFTVVQSKEMLNKINEACRTAILKSGNARFSERAKDENFSIFYNAPTLIIVSGDEKTIAPKIDCALAMENMFLAAESMSIGSCWINAVINLLQAPEAEALKKALGIPDTHVVYSAGSFGYKAMEATAADRKENTITIIK